MARTWKGRATGKVPWGILGSKRFAVVVQIWRSPAWAGGGAYNAIACVRKAIGYSIQKQEAHCTSGQYGQTPKAAAKKALAALAKKL